MVGRQWSELRVGYLIRFPTARPPVARLAPLNVFPSQVAARGLLGAWLARFGHERRCSGTERPQAQRGWGALRESSNHAP